jgi:hypothetical protein
MADRAQELLDVEYFHVVFTLPDTFNSLALHPHIHCVVPGGGLSPDGKWVACRAGFFLPVRVLSRVFRGKFIDRLKRAWVDGELRGVENDSAFARLLDTSVKHHWVVYAKPPFGGPEQVLKYLARYTHRIAISNRRLVSIDAWNVSFRWKDYAHNNRPRTMTLDGAEFLRRFLMHAVPRGFMRIRQFGFLANRVRATNLTICRRLIGTAFPAIHNDATPQLPSCPICQRGHLIAGPNLSPSQLSLLTLRLDSS